MKITYKFLRYKEVKRWEEDNCLYFRFIGGDRVFRLNIYYWEQAWQYNITNDDETNLDHIPEFISSLFATIAEGSMGDVLLVEAIKAVSGKIIN